MGFWEKKAKEILEHDESAEMREKMLGEFIERYGPETIRTWASSLKLFKFAPADWRGEDGDELDLLIRYENDADLISVGSQLGIKLNDDNDGSTRVLHDGFSDYAHLYGREVYIECTYHRMRVSVAGSADENRRISDQDVADAQRIEKNLAGIDLKPWNEDGEFQSHFTGEDLLEATK